MCRVTSIRSRRVFPRNAFTDLKIFTAERKITSSFWFQLTLFEQELSMIVFTISWSPSVRCLDAASLPVNIAFFVDRPRAVGKKNYSVKSNTAVGWRFNCIWLLKRETFSLSKVPLRPAWWTLYYMVKQLQKNFLITKKKVLTTCLVIKPIWERLL